VAWCWPWAVPPPDRHLSELIREALLPYPDSLALVSKVGARRDQSGGWLPYSQPDQLRRGIEDNLRALSGQLAAVNLRLTDAGPPGQQFDDQLAAMIQARQEGLIGGIGLSNITREHLLRALDQTPIACVQNPLNLVDRASMPVLRECTRRGIAFVPFFPLGSAFARPNPLLGNPHVINIAPRLDHTPAHVALAWALGLAPNVLLIPGTSSLRHLEEDLAVADITLDENAQQQLTAIAA
jgi:pyridoxine 4-dehydrogenase